MRRFAVIFGLSLAAGACVPKNGRLEINRFQHEEYPYAVFYLPDGDPVKPLGGDWRVSNFSVEPGNRYAAKKGPEYITERRYDTTGDGQPDKTQYESFYDLLLDHAQQDASMWVRTVPIPPEDKDKALSVLADRYLEAVGSAGKVLVPFGVEAPTSTVDKRFATRVFHSETCTVSKREAYRVDFEVADVDPLQVSSAQARWQRGAVVLVRTGYGHRVTSASGYVDYPALMALGLSARPQDFAALAPDFERLLKQTVLGDVGQGLSMNGETTCQLTAPTAGGETPAASPELPELNEAAQVPLAPEAMPAPEDAP